ncbi:MAG: Lon family ATP-dependent protease [Firmicutes bacterium]|nr:Lon family ATP-dependent protease [Bacillota bacterium]
MTPNYLAQDADINEKIAALEGLLNDVFGPDQIVIRSTKLEILHLLGSSDVEKRLSALEKVVFYDAAYRGKGSLEERVESLMLELGDMIARRNIEDRLEKIVADKMQEKQDDYYREIKLQVLKDQNGPENPGTLKKLEHVKELSERSLGGNAMEQLRPSAISHIVGQEKAVDALLAKLASPYPQHVIVYGPPGVGKTSAARLVLEEAKKIASSAFGEDAPFIEVDGTTLRWDPRETTNPLLGSVHDPIYQGARRDLAETGIPEPKPGLVTDASGGILFIDEIGEMDPTLLNKLLKVLEDKKVKFESSYYDPSDPMVPEYIRFMFDQGLPADFILIGATTRDASELSPALRSRCGEVYFDTLSPDHIKTIVEDAAARLGVKVEDDAAKLISEYTIDGRKAVNILSDAFGLLTYNQRDKKSKRKTIKKKMVEEVLRNARMIPYRRDYGNKNGAVGKIFGLGVYGFLGSVLEIEAVTFKAKEPGKGTVRFNDTAGSMAKDSVFNASSVYRLLTGEDLADYDVHVNVVGGGNIDGPSAGLAVFLAIYSSIKELPIPQDLAVTGEISVRGKVCPVGGIPEKIYGAKQAGLSRVFLPKDNAAEVPSGLDNIRVTDFESVADVVNAIFKK